MPVRFLIIHQVVHLFPVEQAAIKEVEVSVDFEDVVSQPDHLLSHRLRRRPAPGAILQCAPGGVVKLVKLNIRTLERTRTRKLRVHAQSRNVFRHGRLIQPPELDISKRMIRKARLKHFVLCAG